MNDTAIKTVPLPSEVLRAEGTFTWSGKIFLSYIKESDHKYKDRINLAIINDDGSDFTDIYSGPLAVHPTSNGLRWMMFHDNQRVLVGDYILECYPDIDKCESSSFVPLIYPEWLMQSENLWLHWSEIIVSPDGKHISWTTLGGSADGVYVGKLIRKEREYHIENVQCISVFNHSIPDPDNPGCHKLDKLRGGEVKQFVRGGQAISLVGAGYGIIGPVIQDLKTDTITPYFDNPGYDETLILSPDEKHGIIMSTRFSPSTSFDILGLLPRPYMEYILSQLAMPIYNYAVSDVRKFRRGNIGPVLIDLESQTSDDIVGLHDPESEWVYYSPMSWHPDSCKAMWNERFRGNPMRSRLRIVEINDKEPGGHIQPELIPEQIPYSVKPEDMQSGFRMKSHNKKIAGSYSGTLQFSSLIEDNKVIRMIYENYSDEGKTYINGHEAVIIPQDMTGKTVYEANITSRGELTGIMDLRLTLEQRSLADPVRISFDIASDGNPESFGYTEYMGKTLYINDLIEPHPDK